MTRPFPVDNLVPRDLLLAAEDYRAKAIWLANELQDAQADLERAGAEIKRLRAALEHIAEAEQGWPWFQDRVRRALTGGDR